MQVSSPLTVLTSKGVGGGCGDEARLRGQTDGWKCVMLPLPKYTTLFCCAVCSPKKKVQVCTWAIIDPTLVVVFCVKHPVLAAYIPPSSLSPSPCTSVVLSWSSFDFM